MLVGRSGTDRTSSARTMFGSVTEPRTARSFCSIYRAYRQSVLLSSQLAGSFLGWVARAKSGVRRPQIDVMGCSTGVDCVIGFPPRARAALGQHTMSGKAVWVWEGLFSIPLIVWGMATETDERGRLYLRKELRERHGERFHVVEYEDRIELIPISDDPLSAARAAAGDAFEDTSIEDLREEARDQAREDAEADSHGDPE